MRALALLTLLSGPALADSMVATRTLPAQSVLSPDDFTMVKAEIPGALTDPAMALGKETKVILYAGRPILQGDLAAPALIKRNQKVSIIFQSHGLMISTDGRALERGAAGDLIHVMNLSSRLTVTGLIGPDGSVSVGPNSKD